MTYVRMIEDSRGDVVDIEHYCSVSCYQEGTGESAEGHLWPCPERADCPQYCPTCETLTVESLHAELKCPECGEHVWDMPHGSKLAKCWNAVGHASGGTLAFDTMGDDD